MYLLMMALRSEFGSITNLHPVPTGIGIKRPTLDEGRERYFDVKEVTGKNRSKLGIYIKRIYGVYPLCLFLWPFTRE